MEPVNLDLIPYHYPWLMRYAGGKTRRLKYITPFISFREKEMYSPFTGSAALELWCMSQGMEVHINDLFEPVYNFWVQMQHNKREVVSYLSKHYSFADADIRKKVDYGYTDISPEANQAAAFFFLCSCSWGGMPFKSGSSYPNIKAYNTGKPINRFCSYPPLKFSSISNEDCVEFILKHKDKLIYCDPPYVIDNKALSVYGKDRKLDVDFDHSKLAEALYECDRFILSYKHHPKVLALYQKWCDIRYYEVEYTFKRGEMSKELMISKGIDVKEINGVKPLLPF